MDWDKVNTVYQKEDYYGRKFPDDIDKYVYAVFDIFIDVEYCIVEFKKEIIKFEELAKSKKIDLTKT